MPKLIRAVLEPVFNVPVGGSDGKEYMLVNRSADIQTWKLDSNRSWLKAKPRSGRIGPGSSVRVKLTASPPDREGAVHKPVVTLFSADGKVKERCEITTYVIPPYRRPVVPAGAPVYLNELDQSRAVKRHTYAGFTRGDRRRRPWFIPGDPKPSYGLAHGKPRITATTPYAMAKKTFKRGLWVAPNHETTYNVKDAGFSAFAAEVGFYDGVAKSRYANLGAVVSFEVYVDGKLRAQSGLMKFGDAPRLLVVDGLAKATDVKLVTRRSDLVDDWYTSATWGDPRFIKGRPRRQ